MSEKKGVKGFGPEDSPLKVGYFGKNRHLFVLQE